VQGIEVLVGVLLVQRELVHGDELAGYSDSFQPGLQLLQTVLREKLLHHLLQLCFVILGKVEHHPILQVL